MPKKELRKFFNGLLTHLKDYIKRQREEEVKRSFKELPFYGVLIKRPYTKRLNNIGMLRELPFYDTLNITKTSEAFNGYALSYSVKVIDSKDSSVRLTISRPNIKDLIKDLLSEIKGFKY